MINDEEEEFLIADQFDSKQSEPPSFQISSSSNNQESEQYSQSDSHSQDSQESHSIPIERVFPIFFRFILTTRRLLSNVKKTKHVVLKIITL